MKKDQDPCKMIWIYIILISIFVFFVVGAILWSLAERHVDDDSAYNAYLYSAIVCIALGMFMGSIAPIIYYYVTQANPKCRKLRAKANRNYYMYSPRVYDFNWLI